MDVASQKVISFEGFTLDALRRSLRSGDRQIELRPKSFDVLCCLVENAGRVVAKDEIIEAVWPDVTVTDDSLTRCVSDIRAALGDGAQQIVKTAPRKGYMLAVPVAEARQQASGRAAAEAKPYSNAPAVLSEVWRTKRRLRWIGIATMAVALAILGMSMALWRGPMRAPLEDRPSIAVLPFTGIEGEPQQDLLGSAISEDLATSLAKFGSLTVIASGSANQYKGRGTDPRQIGRELGVRYLLQGRLRRDGDQLRVTAQLIDATNGVHIWAERYDRDASKVFAVQDDITQKIVVTLVARVGTAEIERVRRKPPGTLQAYDFCAQGNVLMRSVTRDKRGATIAAARALYEKAIAADRQYAPAYLGLANTYLYAWLEPSPLSPIGAEFHKQTSIDRAQTLAQQAVDLDGTFAEAHAALGWILQWQNRLNDGLAEFERAIAANPNLVDARFAILLIHGGRAPEAIDYVKRIMRLDPLYPPTYTYYLGKAYFFIGRDEEAMELIRASSARLPEHRPSKVLLAAVAALMGRPEEAQSAAKDVIRLQPDFTISNWLLFLRMTSKDYAERLSDGLRKAGLPD